MTRYQVVREKFEKMKKQTSVTFQDTEYDIVQEGSGQYTWYQVCKVLNRNEHGKIDHYIRLRGYGLPRKKKDALLLLDDIAKNGPKDYKEPKEGKKQKYVLTYDLVQVSLEDIEGYGRYRGKGYHIPPVTRKFYRIEEIDDPYKLKNWQTRQEYRGKEVQDITYKEHFDRSKYDDIVRQLNEKYWQERKANTREMVLEVRR